MLPLAVVVLPAAAVWLLPGITVLGKIISTVIYITAASLCIIDHSDRQGDRHRDQRGHRIFGRSSFSKAQVAEPEAAPISKVVVPFTDG